MSISSNRDIENIQNPDILRSDPDLIKDLGKTNSENEEHSLKTTIEKYELYSIFPIFS